MSVCLLAQQPAPAASTLQVSATGQFEADPDTAVIEFEVVGQETELRYAYAKARAQADQVRELLRSQNFAPEAAQVSTYNVEPNLDPQTRRVLNYTVAALITIDVTDFDRIGPLLDAAGASGITSLRSVNFILKNQDAARTAAIADGYRQVRQEANALANAAGVHLDGLLTATVDVSTGSLRPLAALNSVSVTAEPASPISGFHPRRITVTAHIDATYRIQE